MGPTPMWKITASGKWLTKKTGAQHAIPRVAAPDAKAKTSERQTTRPVLQGWEEQHLLCMYPPQALWLSEALRLFGSSQSVRCTIQFIGSSSQHDEGWQLSDPGPSDKSPLSFAWPSGFLSQCSVKNTRIIFRTCTSAGSYCIEGAIAGLAGSYDIASSI